MKKVKRCEMERGKKKKEENGRIIGKRMNKAGEYHREKGKLKERNLIIRKRKEKS